MKRRYSTILYGSFPPKSDVRARIGIALCDSTLVKLSHGEIGLFARW